MRFELKPDKKRWLATSDTKLRAHGATPVDALVTMKRASLKALAKKVDEVIEWQEIPRRDVETRDLRVLGKQVKWTRRPRRYTGLDAQTLAWLIEQRFVLAEQDMVLGRTAATVLAALASNPGATASGFLVGPGPACRVEIEALVDARGKPLRASQLPESLYETVIERVVELSLDEQPDGGWRYRSKGGIVDGVAKTLARARHDAASRAWAALAVRLSAEDLARTAIMRIEFAVTPGAQPARA